MEINYITRKVKFLYEREGLAGPFRALGRKFYYYGIRVPSNSISYAWAATVRKSRFPTFSFQGGTYPYLYSFKNFAWMSERTAEAALVLPYLAEAYAAKKKVLEVGDVMRQYTRFKTHDIVDKYEYRTGVTNVDIVDFKPKHKYDLIISVSTIEHVGWDAPDEKDPEKIPLTLRLLKSFLAPGGIAVITMPIGWNPEVDKRLKAHVFPFTKTYFMKRISKGNQWEEATEAEALSKKYGHPFPTANAIVMGIIQ